MLRRLMKERGIETEREELLARFDKIIEENHQGKED
jgi:hypothetical protein